MSDTDDPRALAERLREFAAMNLWQEHKELLWDAADALTRHPDVGMMEALKQIIADSDATQAEFAGRPIPIRNSSIDAARTALANAQASEARKFKFGDRVRKIKGSSWQGRVCGFYTTELTPFGYNVESEREPGSVQIYPEAALERVPPPPHPEGSASS